MRDREYLVAIFSDGGLLRAETLRFATEVRSSAAVGLPKRTRPEPRVLEKVTRAVSALEEKRWDPSELTDSHAALRKLAEEKSRRKQDVVRLGERASKPGGSAVDLEVLRKSLAESSIIANDASKRHERSSSKSPSTPSRASKGTARARPSSKSRTRKRTRTAARKP
jgi:non-homologous end joining protein Ku